MHLQVEAGSSSQHRFGGDDRSGAACPPFENHLFLKRCALIYNNIAEAHVLAHGHVIHEDAVFQARLACDTAISTDGRHTVDPTAGRYRCAFAYGEAGNRGFYLSRKDGLRGHKQLLGSPYVEPEATRSNSVNRRVLRKKAREDIAFNRAGLAQLDSLQKLRFEDVEAGVDEVFTGGG